MCKQDKMIELFKRIEEYRVDFAYTRQSNFNAFERVSKQNKKNAPLRKRLALSSIVISIITLSALTIYLNQLVPRDFIIYIVSGLSIISLAISIYLISENKIVDGSQYLDMAESYSILYKKIKNYEAKYNCGLENTFEDVRENLSYFETEQEKLMKNSLEIKPEDYSLAQEQIRKGNYGYSEIDYKNT